MRSSLASCTDIQSIADHGSREHRTDVHIGRSAHKRDRLTRHTPESTHPCFSAHVLTSRSPTRRSDASSLDVLLHSVAHPSDRCLASRESRPQFVTCTRPVERSRFGRRCPRCTSNRCGGPATTCRSPTRLNMPKRVQVHSTGEPWMAMTDFRGREGPNSGDRPRSGCY